MLESLISGIQLHTVFIYITEKCNLTCSYCYFKDKRGRTLALPVIKKFIGLLVNAVHNQSFDIEISGGEPLAEWDLVKGLIVFIRKGQVRRRLGIQTNGLFLDKEKIFFLRDNNVAVEIGIDGSLETTTRYRAGIKKVDYHRLIRLIQLAKGIGINTACTMTVHPGEAAAIMKNYAFLRNLGLSDIDITPAAFMKWDKKSVEAFKDQYLGIMKQGDSNQSLYTLEDSTYYPGRMLDLSLHPPGYVLCGDAYLCLREDVRSKFSLFSFKDKAVLREKILTFFLDRYKEGMGAGETGHTYKDYINASFRIVNKISGGRYLDAEPIIELHNFLKRIHLNPGLL